MEINFEELKLSFLSKKSMDVVINVGETLLGVPKSDLGSEFIQAFDNVVLTIDEYLQKDLRTLFSLFNSRILSLLMIGSFRKFTSMPDPKKRKYMQKWIHSRISLFRTAYKVFQNACGWSYYSLEKCYPELNYPGLTIGREHETPTLLFGKQPWSPKEVEG